MQKTLVCLLSIAVVCWAGGSLYAAHSDYGCHNCHVPHHAAKPGDPNSGASWGVPLWSTAQTSDGLPSFTLYSSPTFNALATDIGQPDGPTKLCLGCHDGSYIAFSYMPDSKAKFTAAEGLARSHPVSFTYDLALTTRVKVPGSLKVPTEMSGLGGTIAHDLLDEMGKMQCTSCHDVHTSGKGDYLLRYDYNVSTHTDNVICRVCHNK
jgi:predicted CXXCH cytochrome family protein